MNPFENSFIGNYCDHVCLQVSKISSGESVAVDLGGKQVQSFRMTLNKVCQQSGRLAGMKFKTKSSSDGSVWVKRIY